MLIRRIILVIMCSRSAKLSSEKNCNPHLNADSVLLICHMNFISFFFCSKKTGLIHCALNFQKQSIWMQIWYLDISAGHVSLHICPEEEFAQRKVSKTSKQNTYLKHGIRIFCSCLQFLPKCPMSIGFWKR